MMKTIEMYWKPLIHPYCPAHLGCRSTINAEIPKPFQAAEKSAERQSPGSALDMSETSHLGPTQLAS